MSTIDLDAYFQRIGYAGVRTPTLETLCELHLLHAQTIPFENLTPLLKQPVNLDAESLERKLVHDTVAEMGEQRATGFLKKFYGWYLRGRFPKPFANELVRLDTIEQVEDRLFAAAPGAAEALARLEGELPEVDQVVLDLPVSIYAGG